ncbi:thioesterase II family protein [Rhodopseudomonas sp. NSM]|uniref:thioesterase II family protein n=1 Tax=Rhodopseudomonas sp. NSM TaxID=3457630 RepID=UPI0040364E15
MRHIEGHCPAAIDFVTAIQARPSTEPDHKPPAPAILRWIRRIEGAPVVICFPHAGGSVLSCMGLAAALPDHLAIATVAVPRQPCGRLIADARRIAGAVAGEIALALDPQSAGLTLLGNSFGALLAFETAVALERLEAPVAQRLHLVVSGFRSPSRPPCDAPLHRLPRARLLAELRECFGAVGPGLGDLIGDTQEAELRADIEACETYRPGDAPALRCALSVIRLLADPSVSDQEYEAWRDICAGPVRFRALDSGHFPWSGATAALAGLVTELIAVTRPVSADPGPASAARSAIPLPTPKP